MGISVRKMIVAVVVWRRRQRDEEGARVGCWVRELFGRVGNSVMGIVETCH